MPVGPFFALLLPVVGNYLFERFAVAKGLSFLPFQIQQSLTAKLGDDEKQQSLIAKLQKGQSLTDELEKVSNMTVVQEVSRDGFAMVMSDGSVKAVPQVLFDKLSSQSP